MSNRSCLRPLFAAIAALALMAAPALAVTRTNLADGDQKPNFGTYAPRGDCAAEPRLTIDATGLTFRALGRTQKPTRFEHAVSYLGPEYNGIAAVFFPFMVSDDDLGRLVVTVNDNEKRGVVRLEADLPPGQRLDPFQAALLAASPLRRCGAPSPAAPAAITPPATTAGTPWERLPVAGRAPIATVDAARSPGITSFSLFCDRNQPVIAMLLNKPSREPAIILTWNFSGQPVTIPMRRGNAAGTFWQGALAGSQLVPMLLSRSGTALLRLNGRPEGEVSLAKAPEVLRGTIGGCIAA